MRTRTTHRRLVTGAVAGAAAITLAIGLTGSAQAHDDDGDELHAKLTGAAEVPGPGDTDGRGKAHVFADQDESDIICVDLRVRDIERATAAHIHKAPVGVAAPPLITLTAPIGGRSRACAVSTAAQVADIMANPQEYYVNVHNATFPGGALRGQLR